MNNRSRKRWVYARFYLRGKTIWLTAEDREWLNIVPIGREFGSKDYERLAMLDAFTQGRMKAMDARKLLGIDQDELDAMAREEGLPAFFNGGESELDDLALRAKIAAENSGAYIDDAVSFIRASNQRIDQANSKQDGTKKT